MVRGVKRIVCASAGVVWCVCEWESCEVVDGSVCRVCSASVVASLFFVLCSVRREEMYGERGMCV